MEKRIFHTKIGKTSCEYVRGRISGMMAILCDVYPHDGHAMKQLNSGNYLLTVECTEEQYEQFKRRVKLHYPRVCSFDYKMNTELK